MDKSNDAYVHKYVRRASARQQKGANGAFTTANIATAKTAAGRGIRKEIWKEIYEKRYEKRCEKKCEKKFEKKCEKRCEKNMKKTVCALLLSSAGPAHIFMYVCIV